MSDRPTIGGEYLLTIHFCGREAGTLVEVVSHVSAQHCKIRTVGDWDSKNDLVILDRWLHKEGSPPMAKIDPVHPDRVRTRIEARTQARQLLELINVPEEHSDVYVEMLLETLQKDLNRNRTPPTPRSPVIPLARLAHFRIPFGRYEGQSIKDVPMEYIDWLISAQEETLKALRDYQNHPERKSLRRCP